MAEYKETEVVKMLHIQRKVLYNIRQKGLISPSTTESHGKNTVYNFYDDEAITRLWLILRYREFGYSYAEIKKIMDGTAENRNQMLRKMMIRLDHMKILAEFIYETGILPPSFLEMNGIMDDKFFKPLTDKKIQKNDRIMAEQIFGDEKFNQCFHKITELYNSGKTESDPEIQKAVSDTEKAFEQYASPSGARKLIKNLGELFTGKGNIQQTTEIGNAQFKNLGRAYLWYINNTKKEK